MTSLFQYCERLKQITGLSDWDVSNVKDTVAMFNSCGNLKKFRIFQIGIQVIY